MSRGNPRIALFVTGGLLLLACIAVGGFWFGREAGERRQASVTPPVTASASPAAGETPCKVTDLTASVRYAEGAAGSRYVTLVLANSGTRSCTVMGYPGVSLVDAEGGRLGAAATRADGDANTRVRLAAGAVASATLRLPNAGNFEDGTCSASSARLKVFPPDETQALTVPFEAQACPGFSVTPLVGGASDPAGN